MDRRPPRIALVTALGLLLATAIGGSAAAEPVDEDGGRPPNVVFILADDLGWSDTTLHGHPGFYETPNVGRLAGRGLRFSQAYAANPLCSPTRASILTGLFPARIGITSPVCHLPEVVLEKGLEGSGNPRQKVILARSLTRLKAEYVTLAEVLKDAGYATGHFGKWHLGREPYSPLEQGFDVDVPHWWGPAPAGSYLAPWRFPPEVDLPAEPGEHIEDRMAEEAVAFIEAHEDRPFFLNYWAFSVHGPWIAKPELVERYRGAADPDAERRNPVYAAMVHSLDDAVGRLLDAIDRLGLADDTILVFFSDNGGVHWLDQRMEENFGLESPPTSNRPLRGGKATIYEGGTRVPCVVVAPGVTTPGAATDALLSSVDFLPTLLELAGLEVPEGVEPDGVSQAAVLRDPDASARDAIFCHFPHGAGIRPGSSPSTSIRQGDWKLIRFHGDAEGGADRFELYDLAADLGEQHDRAAEQPGRVSELLALMQRHLDETEAVIPVPNPNYNPRRAAR